MNINELVWDTIVSPQSEQKNFDMAGETACCVHCVAGQIHRLNSASNLQLKITCVHSLILSQKLFNFDPLLTYCRLLWQYL